MDRHPLFQRLGPAIVTGVMLASTLAGPAAWAQAAPPVSGGPVASQMPMTPTTRVLAIGRLTKPPTGAEFQAIMPGEVRDTLDLYLAGKIADWYVTKEAPGVAFILDLRSVDEARQLTAALPLVKSGYMSFQLIPLGPLAPLKLLAK
jgi:hypothetical protein